jgi:hypothetical protein
MKRLMVEEYSIEVAIDSGRMRSHDRVEVGGD